MAIRATATAGEKIAFSLAFRDTSLGTSGSGKWGQECERSTLKETRNENVFPDVCQQIENPDRRLCESSLVRLPLNAEWAIRLN